MRGDISRQGRAAPSMPVSVQIDAAEPARAPACRRFGLRLACRYSHSAGSIQ